MSQSPNGLQIVLPEANLAPISEEEPDDSPEPAPLPSLNVEFLSPRATQSKRRQRRISVSAEADTQRSPNSMLKRQQQRPIIPKSFETKKRIEQAMSSCLLVSSLTADQHQEIIDAMSELRVKAGDAIIKQGEDGDYFYVIDCGRFKVFKRNSDNPEQEDFVFEYNESGSFGELALLYNCPRAATVRAETDGVVWKLDRETFKQIVVTNAMVRRRELDQVIRQLEFFGNMDSEHLSHLTDSVQHNRSSAGQMILRQGERGNLFYIITEGSAVVTLEGDDGKQTVVNRLKKGDHFGEIALLRGVERQASVVAGKNGCSFVTMDHSTFLRVLDQAQIKLLTDRMCTYQRSPLDGDSDEDEKADDIPVSPQGALEEPEVVAANDEDGADGVANIVEDQPLVYKQEQEQETPQTQEVAPFMMSFHLRMIAVSVIGLLAGIGFGMMLKRSGGRRF